MTQIFLLAGNTTFPDPGNWGLPNRVECVGSGNAGTLNGPSPPQGFYTGPGGGGGSYGVANNLTPTFPVNVNVMGPVSGGMFYTTFGSSAAQGKTGALVWAQSAQASNGGTDFGPAGFAGGNGFFPNSGQSGPGGGGGGAGGPHGAGATGSGTTGGTGDAGHTPAATNGTQFDPSHGIGGGGNGGAGGGGSTVAAGNYGAGGGSQGLPGTGPQGGSPGLLVITYNPYSLHYGIVRGVTSKSIYMTVKPPSYAKDDSELDNPAWLQLGGTVGGEALQMLKVDRLTYNSWTSYSQLVAWVAAQP